MTKKRTIDAQSPEGNPMCIIAAVTGYLRGSNQGNKTASAAKELMNCGDDRDTLYEKAFHLTEGNVEVVNQ